MVSFLDISGTSGGKVGQYLCQTIRMHTALWHVAFFSCCLWETELCQCPGQWLTCSVYMGENCKMLSSLHYEYNTFVDAAFVKTNKQTNTYMQQTTHLGSAHISSLTGTFFIIDDL